MPHLSPTSWMLIYFIMMIQLTIIMIFMYFFFFLINNKLMINKSPLMPLLWNWKW